MPHSTASEAGPVEWGYANTNSRQRTRRIRFRVAQLGEAFVPRKEWPRIGRNRQATARYLWSLRRLLRLCPELQRRLVHCRDCSLAFVTPSCNRKRCDLRCHFGCRVQHERMASMRRSAAWYRTDEGRQNKKDLNARRAPRHRPGRANRATEATAEDAAMGSMPSPSSSPPTSVGEPPLEGQPVSASPVNVKPAPLVHSTVPWAVMTSVRPPKALPSRSTPTAPAMKVDRPSPAPPLRAPGPTPPTHIVSPVVEPSPPRLTLTPMILAHLCDVLSVVEKRPIGAAEVLNLLEQLVRQRRLGNGTEWWQDAPPRCTGPP